MELHGGWLLVTRKKKMPINSTLISAKTSTNKNNRFIVLSNTSPKIKPGPQNTKLPPCPKPAVIARVSSSHETKRQRSDDHHHDQTLDSIVDPSSIGQPRTTKPVRTIHMADTRMGFSLTKHSISSANNHEKHTEPNNILEPIPTAKINTTHQPETSNNNHNISSTNNIVTDYDSIHTMQNPSDEQVKVKDRKSVV